MRAFKAIFGIMFCLFAMEAFSQENSFIISPGIRYNIITGSNADSLTLRAVTELQKYFMLITGKPLEVRSDRAAHRRNIFIGSGGLTDKSVTSEIAGLSRDGFLISAASDRLILAGNNGMANLYALYTMLEENAGCMRFTGDEELVPEASEIAVPYQNRKHEPAFAFRIAHFADREKPVFTDWNRLSIFSEWGMFVHTFSQLMPPASYFNDHPEYYSLVNGRRIQDGQLCLSNPQVIKLLGDNLEERMKKAPEKKYWSVSQNDCINYCECPECRKLYEKYGNISGAYVEMANTLAQRFPDKQISTLAYQFTRQAPSGIVPLPNVNIMFCSIECNRSMPLAEDKRSADFVKDLQDWSRLTHNIFMWDYVVQFKTYLCPFPNFHVLQPNIKLFHEYKIPMMFQQGSGRSWSDLSELKQYYVAKLLWDPDLGGDSLINRFMTAYYGEAAQFIKEYFTLSHSRMKEDAEAVRLDIYGLPANYFGSFLSKDLLVRYHDLMDRAEEAVADDPAILPRVLRARTAVDFAWLDYALNAGDSTLSFIKVANGRKSLNEKMVKALDRVIENSRATGVTAVSEHNYSLEDYRENVMHNLFMGIKENKAKPQDFKSLTSFHPRYSFMGAGSMADGIFGGRSFSSGWLGYEGEDMIMEITPENPVVAERVSMNFLRDHVSWIFMPTEIIIELSENGSDFIKVTDEKFQPESYSQETTPVNMVYSFPETMVRKIKITARSLKQCPDWHRGAGMPSWIFIDEIVVE